MLYLAWDLYSFSIQYSVFSIQYSILNDVVMVVREVFQ
ncbi:Uncharacterised protein [Yersinia similis]|nr:Uncharacterised protein [Yersinia similis]